MTESEKEYAGCCELAEIGMRDGWPIGLMYLILERSKVVNTMRKKYSYGSKSPLIDVENKVYYRSIKRAAKVLNISYGVLKTDLRKPLFMRRYKNLRAA